MGGVTVQQAKGNLFVMVDNGFFTDPVQGGHRTLLFFLTPQAHYSYYTTFQQVFQPVWLRFKQQS
jgi:hypothetical protein